MNLHYFVGAKNAAKSNENFSSNHNIIQHEGFTKKILSNHNFMQSDRFFGQFGQTNFAANHHATKTDFALAKYRYETFLHSSTIYLVNKIFLHLIQRDVMSKIENNKRVFMSVIFK